MTTTPLPQNGSLIAQLQIRHYLRLRAPLLDWTKSLRIEQIPLELNAAIYAAAFVVFLFVYTLFWYFSAVESKIPNSQKGTQTSTPENAPDKPNRTSRHLGTPSNRSVMII